MVKISSEALCDAGCNIASGIVLETFNSLEIKDVKYFINIRTLYRNFINCLEGNTADKISILKSSMNISEVYNLFIEDTRIFIESLLSMHIDVTIYVPDYKKLKSSWSNFRDVSNINGLKFYIYSTEQDLYNLLVKEFSEVLLKTNHKIPYYRNLYITTHIGHDLLSYVKYSNVKVIESHTGEIKEKDKWYTKFHKLGTKNLSIIPFIPSLYVLFGDNDYLKPQNVKLRKYIYDIAIENKWYHRTLEYTVLNNIKNKDIPLYNDIKKLKYDIF